MRGGSLAVDGTDFIRIRNTVTKASCMSKLSSLTVLSLYFQAGAAEQAAGGRQHALQARSAARGRAALLLRRQTPSHHQRPSATATEGL